MDKDKNILGYSTTDGGIGDAGSYATFKLYKADTSDSSKPASTAISFVETEKSVTEDSSDTNKGLLYSYRVADSSQTGTETIKAGDVRIGGLGTGTYYLVEQEAPDGYNKATENIKVVVDKDGITIDSASKTARYATVTVGANNRTDTGVKSGTYTSGGVAVENEAGSELPNTGGSGTMMFYAIGLLLIGVAASGIMMKKRQIHNA